MVSSIQSATFAPALGALAHNRPQPAPPKASPSSGDQVDVGSYASALKASRDALENAVGTLDLALASGREAANLVAQIRDLARAAVGAGSGTRAEADGALQALLQRYGQVVDGAIEGGAGVLAGAAISIPVDPEAPAVTVQGYDLRLKAQPGTEDVLRLSANASLAGEGEAVDAARDADASLARIDVALSRLSGSAQKLAAHEGFLSSLEAALGGAIVDFDAEGARLAALQVRQGLASGAIANAQPAALLALFRE